MRRMNLAPLNLEQILELDGLYRTTRDVRLRTRAQMILLAGEQGMSTPEIAVIVREIPLPVVSRGFGKSRKRISFKLYLKVG